MKAIYINACANNRETIKLAVEKSIGKSEFKDKNSVDTFYGAWDTH